MHSALDGEFAAVAIVVAFAGGLTLAATTKVTSVSLVRETIRTLLPLPTGMAAVLAALLIVSEWLLAAALVITPHSGVVQIAVGVLFSLFAGAGTYAVITGRRIECACFGTFRSRRLGWRQVALFPVAIAGLLVIAASDVQTGTAGAVGLLFGVQMAVGSILAWRMSRGWRLVRDQRVSLASARRELVDSAVARAGGAA